MYYDHDLYKLLRDAWHVSYESDVLIIIRREGDEPRRVPYASLNESERGAALRFIGVRIAAIKRELERL